MPRSLQNEQLACRPPVPSLQPPLAASSGLPPPLCASSLPPWPSTVRLHRALRRMAALVFLWFSWVLAGACQRHGGGGFVLRHTTTSTTPRNVLRSLLANVCRGKRPGGKGPHVQGPRAGWNDGMRARRGRGAVGAHCPGPY